ncbi:hypothetical protein JW933_02195 [candidate division FCPU426 bacterium]|nr:hypothetical protein [candidate division FCPU426 bacterium]
MATAAEPLKYAGGMMEEAKKKNQEQPADNAFGINRGGAGPLNEDEDHEKKSEGEKESKFGQAFGQDEDEGEDTGQESGFPGDEGEEEDEEEKDQPF